MIRPGYRNAAAAGVPHDRVVNRLPADDLIAWAAARNHGRGEAA